MAERELTFYGAGALAKNQEVYLASEHYLVQLTDEGWKILEVDDNEAARNAAALIHTAK